MDHLKAIKERVDENMTWVAENPRDFNGLSMDLLNTYANLRIAAALERIADKLVAHRPTPETTRRCPVHGPWRSLK